MTVFKATNKIFRRSIILLVPYVLFLIFTVCYGIHNTKRGHYLALEGCLIQMSLFAFILFAFLAFEFFSKCRNCHMEEGLICTGKGYKKFLAVQFVFFTILISVFTLLMIVFEVLLCIVNNAMNEKLIIQVLAGALLNYFLIPVMGACFGLFFSLIAKRLNAYLMLVLICLISSPMFNDIGLLIYAEGNGIDITPFFNLFDFFTPDLTWRPVYALGHSILPYRWITVFFWCFFLIALSLCKMSIPKTNKNYLKQLPVFMLAAICFITCLIPSSKVKRNSDNPTDSVMADYEYYSDEKNAETIQTKESDFSITECEAQLSADLKLRAKVSVTVDKTNLKEYCFTLYHGYKLKAVTDENKNHLDFEQNGDCITVYNESQISKILMTYSGYSPQFYTNAQGIFLPAYFPYLPHSGWSPVYDRNHQGINRFFFDENTSFDIKVNGLQKTYCNFEETDKNHFTGKGTGATLVSGLYEETKVDGIKVIYPFMDPTDTPEVINNTVTKYKGKPSIKDGVKTIIAIPNINLISPYNKYADCKDHIVTEQIISIPSSYWTQISLPERYDLFMYCNMNYKQDPDYAREQAKEEKDGSLAKLFISYIDKYGEEEGLKNITAFCTDENDTRSVEEFLTGGDDNA